MSDAVVIIGTGLAGYNLARELRKADPNLPITLVSQDEAGFYSKPMLSNALASHKSATSLVMKSAAKMAEELNARILPNTTVLCLDARQRQLELSTGEVLPYRDVVLALGAQPVQIGLTGDATDALISINHLQDFARFAQALDTAVAASHAPKVIILGAGLIGCEFANDLLARGLQATVIDPAQQVLSRLLPLEASQNLQAKLMQAGVRFQLGLSAQSLHRTEHGLRLTLSNGQALDADVVISAVGLKPHTQLAADAGADVAQGVVVNTALQTSLPHVYALGDCAQVNGTWLPYVMPLMHQARALAQTLSGKPTEVNYPAMPIVVKTPAWPTVTCPPVANAPGTWHTQITEEGLEAKFMSTDADPRVLGFVLQGKATALRQAYLSQLA